MPWESALSAAAEPAWAPPEEEQPAAAAAMPEDMPFGAEPEAVAQEESYVESYVEEAPVAEAAAEAEPAEPPMPSPVLAPEAPSIPISARDLTDEQVDRIARRVVELMSDHVVRNIAWEVIPDLAEMVVKERIRQLESEA